MKLLASDLCERCESDPAEIWALSDPSDERPVYWQVCRGCRSFWMDGDPYAYTSKDEFMIEMLRREL